MEKRESYNNLNDDCSRLMFEVNGSKYLIGIYFEKNKKETMMDKIKYMIKKDIINNDISA